MKGRINRVIERWFLSEPVLFQVLCLHELEENLQMDCPLRSGRRRVEYNPAFLSVMDDRALEEALRTEAVRLLLKHPYERRPDGCSQQAISVGSDIVVGDNYQYASYRIDKPGDYALPEGMAYEWYSRQIESMLPREEGGGAAGSDSDEDDTPRERLRERATRNRDLSALWEEDEMTIALINGVIDGCQSWGSLEGAFAEMLRASTRARIDWKNVLRGFRASILSSKRQLTRMRPSRRTDFENMGSVRRFDTRLLLAVDVSGSISTESLQHFYGVINSAFRYGFEEVDVIQFDQGIRLVESLRRRVKDVLAVGRGGTSFDEPIRYAHEMGYEGLLILTDGYAPRPHLPKGFKCRIMWVCQNEACYERHQGWMRLFGRVCFVNLN